MKVAGVKMPIFGGGFEYYVILESWPSVVFLDLDLHYNCCISNAFLFRKFIENFYIILCTPMCNKVLSVCPFKTCFSCDIFSLILFCRYAPCNPVLLEGEALASAAANRSAAFYQTKQYMHAIDDIGEIIIIWV